MVWFARCAVCNQHPSPILLTAPILQMEKRRLREGNRPDRAIQSGWGATRTRTQDPLLSAGSLKCGVCVFQKFKPCGGKANEAGLGFSSFFVSVCYVFHVSIPCGTSKPEHAKGKLCTTSPYPRPRAGSPRIRRGPWAPLLQPASQVGIPPLWSAERSAFLGALWAPRRQVRPLGFAPRLQASPAQSLLSN